MTCSDLVFDIGMHNGDDTAYYLAKGYRVVAVEANPVLCSANRDRFRNEIATDRLRIRNVGIAEVSGTMPFWVSSHSEWSSFCRDNAVKGGATATCIEVETTSFANLLDEEGVPYFTKIDIEMNDGLCLLGLAESKEVPEFLSIESSTRAREEIHLLADLGYNRFKCIRQNDWREMTTANVVFQQEVRRLLCKLPNRPGTRRVNGLIRGAHYRSRQPKDWTFPHGSSGPPGMELPGRWLSEAEVLSVWHQLEAYDLRLDAGGLGEWYDIHAARG